MQESDFYRPPSNQDPPAPSRRSTRDGTPVPWEPGEVIGAAWEVVKEHWLVLIFAILIATWLPSIPSWVINQTVGVINHTGGKEGAGQAVGAWIAGALVQLALGALFGAGLCRLLVAASRREPVDFGALAQGGPAFWRMVGADVLLGLLRWALVVVTMAPAAALAVGEMGLDAFTSVDLFKHRIDRLDAAPVLAFAVGSLVLLVLTVLVTIRLHFAPYYVVDADRGPLEALGSSWAATRGNVGNLVVFAVLSWLICLAGLVACCVGFFPALAVVRLAHAIIYTRISGRTGEAAETT
jgi:uncharacterized membrane protein